MTRNQELLSDATLTPDQRRMVDQLSEATIKKIDQTLLSNASLQWSKVDRIVLTTMIELDNGMGLPKVYFAERIAQLVQEGLLEAEGEVTSLGNCGVRLKNNAEEAEGEH